MLPDKLQKFNKFKLVVLNKFWWFYLNGVKNHNKRYASLGTWPRFYIVLNIVHIVQTLLTNGFNYTYLIGDNYKIWTMLWNSISNKKTVTYAQNVLCIVQALLTNGLNNPTLGNYFKISTLILWNSISNNKTVTYAQNVMCKVHLLQALLTIGFNNPT